MLLTGNIKSAFAKHCCSSIHIHTRMRAHTHRHTYTHTCITRDTRVRQILYCGASASKHNEFAVHQRSYRRSSRRDKQLRNGLLKKEAIRLAHIYVTTAQAQQWPRACNGNASKVFSWVRVRVTSVSTFQAVCMRPPRFAISPVPLVPCTPVRYHVRLLVTRVCHT